MDVRKHATEVRMTGYSPISAGNERDGDWEFYGPELSTICAISTYSIVGATR